jgi:hypothetical protein
MMADYRVQKAYKVLKWEKLVINTIYMKYKINCRTLAHEYCNMLHQTILKLATNAILKNSYELHTVYLLLKRQIKINLCAK